MHAPAVRRLANTGSIVSNVASTAAATTESTAGSAVTARARALSARPLPPPPARLARRALL